MILDHTQALDFRCRRCGIYLRYFAPPIMRPTACGSRDFEPADAAEARRYHEQSKHAARDAAAPIH